MLARRHVLALALLSSALVPPARAARWVELSPADTTRPVAHGGHTAILDAPGRRLVAWGGRIPGEAWSMPLNGPGIWQRLQPTGTPPPRFLGASAIFDPVRRRMLIFGGGPGVGGFALSNDVYALTLDQAPRWEKLEPAGTRPALRQLHAAIYDPVRDRMLVFGGFSTTGPPQESIESSVWELTLSGTPTWRQVGTAGLRPRARFGASMVYDAARNRAIVFGGNGTWPPLMYMNDVWELALDDDVPVWRQLSPTGTPPSARYGHVAAMDDAHGRMLVFGGRGLNIIPTADVFALDLSVEPPAWRRAGPDASFPRYHSAAILDPVTNCLIVDGGFSARNRNVDDTIELNLSIDPPIWIRLGASAAPSAPARRTLAVPLVDPLTEELVLQGGYDFTTLGAADSAADYVIDRDLWTWPLDSRAPRWTRRSTTLTPFLGPGRAVLDQARHRQVRFFQDRLSPNAAPGVGVMPLDRSGDWVPLAVTGDGPQLRTDFSTVYDPVRDRVLLAGGYIIPNTRGYTRQELHDVWALSLAGQPTWTQLIADAPDGLVLAPEALFFDPKADQFVALGYNGLAARSGTWVLPAAGGTAWSFVSPFTNFYPTVTFDPDVRELVVVDLADGEGEAWHHVLSDTAGWVPMVVSGEVPEARLNSRVELDPFRHRVLTFGGQQSGEVAAGDLWALELDRAFPRLFDQPVSDHVLLGWNSNLAPGTVVGLERRVAGEGWATLPALTVAVDGDLFGEDPDVHYGVVVDYRLRYAGTVLPGSEQRGAGPSRPTFALAGARPNPALGTANLVFSLPGASPARLDVFDLAGRLVESHAVGGLGTGHHVLSLEKHLAPGLYMAVLSRSGQRLTRRFVVAR